MSSSSSSPKSAATPLESDPLASAQMAQSDPPLAAISTAAIALADPDDIPLIPQPDESDSAPLTAPLTTPLSEERPHPDSPHRQDLVSRRQQLRARRKIKFYTLAWRTAVVGGLALGTVWLAQSPLWLIRSSDQISVENNQLLSEDNVRSLLPVPYPQSLLEAQPNQLAKSLSAYEPIADAVVTRRLLPPGLSVQVTERVPVAVTLPDTTAPITTLPDQPVPFETPGLIDAQGYWMPRSSFTDLGAIASPPPLIVKGMRASYRSAWQTIYRGLSQSPVTVSAIDWTRADNLILQTELGPIHLGPFDDDFERQLKALDQLREIRQELEEAVVFIDLKDPEHPVVQVLDDGPERDESPDHSSDELPDQPL